MYMALFASLFIYGKITGISAYSVFTNNHEYRNKRQADSQTNDSNIPRHERSTINTYKQFAIINVIHIMHS